MEELSGGREASIYRKDNIVYRPLQPWSSTVHRILDHFQEAGITETPKFLGIEGGKEKLSYLQGNTFNYPLVGAITTQEALMSAATLLRKIHDASVSFLKEIDVSSKNWMLRPRVPFEVVCHGDFAPYNVALKGNTVSGVFDFDAVHPAPRSWDLAYSVYCWAPFKTDEVCKLGALDEQVFRAKLFCDGYGANHSEREQLAALMIARLEALIGFMLEQARRGDSKFVDDINNGHHQAYQRDIEYIDKNRLKISQGLTC